MSVYTFQRKAMDVEYRIISLQNQQIPDYESFAELQQIQIFDDNVLEIRSQDGTERIWTGRAQKRIQFVKQGSMIEIPESVPLHRLWIRNLDNPKMWYKIPTNLPVKNGHYEVMVPAGTHNLEVCADQYFCAVYKF